MTTLLDQIHPRLAEEIRRVAQEAHDKLPASATAALDRAVWLLLEDAVTPPSAEHPAYHVHDGDVQAITVDPDTGQFGPCACGDETVTDRLCAHRLAVRLYLRSHAALQATLAQELPATVPHIFAGTQITEAPAVVLVDVFIQGRLLRYTLRDTDEMRLTERVERLLARYPMPPGAPRHDHADTSPAPEGSATPVEWCTYHDVGMQDGAKGPYHQVGPGLYCPGHWCQEHNERYWERHGKNGTWWEHTLPDGSKCKEKKPGKNAGR